jgi:hypothetical protein
MRDRTLLGGWVRRFLLEHLVSDPQPGAQHAAELPRWDRSAHTVPGGSAEKSSRQAPGSRFVG